MQLAPTRACVRAITAAYRATQKKRRARSRLRCQSVHQPAQRRVQRQRGGMAGSSGGGGGGGGRAVEGEPVRASSGSGLGKAYVQPRSDISRTFPCRSSRPHFPHVRKWKCPDMSPRVMRPPPILCLKTHAENATKRAPYEGGPRSAPSPQNRTVRGQNRTVARSSQQADAFPAQFRLKGRLLCRSSSDTVTPCRDI